MRLEQSIKDFYTFLCNPTFNYKSDSPDSFKNLSIILALLFIVNIAVAQMMFTMIGLDDSSHKLTQMLEELPIYLIFILAVILAPLIEEFVFRGFLRYPSSIIGIITGCILGLLIFLKFNNTVDWVIFGVGTFASVALFIYLSQNKKVLESLKHFFIRYFGFFFYASVVIFAYVHITNFTEVTQWYLTPILVMPQFILGLFLGYVRVRNNLWASIGIHALNNAIPMTLLLLSPELAGI